MVQNFRRDARGSVIIYTAVALPVLLGFVGLAIDAGNLYSLTTQLQKAADASALAGAKSLTGGVGSIANARAAAKTSAANFAPLSTSSAQIAIVDANITFYSGAHCDTLLDPAAAGSDNAAVCVRVVTNASSLSFRLLAAVGVTLQPAPTATAMAESRYVACDVTPLMLCTTNTINMDGAAKGKQYKLASQATNVGSWFGRLLPPSESGDTASGKNQAGAVYLASSTPKACFTNSIIPDNGHDVGPTDQGVGSRFDIYPNGNGPWQSLMQANAPAPQSFSGLVTLTVSKKCVNNPTAYSASPATAFPRDTVFDNDVMGNGVQSAAARTQYATMMHPITGSAAAKLNAQTMQNFVNTATNTRYDIYLKELQTTDAAVSNGSARFSVSDLNALQNAGWYPSDGTNQDHGIPQCYQDTTPTNNNVKAFNANRRIIYVAVVPNCYDVSKSEATTNGINTAKYAKMFLTETSNGGTIYAEFISWLTPGADDGKLHHIVELVD
jgi:Flp pilus assembly protein TadG